MKYPIADTSSDIEALAVDPTGLNVEFGGYTTAGIKAVNQDAFSALQPESNDRIYKGAVAAIADGVSCSARSDEASQVSMHYFIEEYYGTPESWSVKESASRVLNALNSWLYHQGIMASSTRNELVTTFSSVIFKSTTAHLFHVGDSRIYRFRDGDLELLTRDHCQQKASGNALLTRALGMDLHLEVDYLQEELEGGDIFLLVTDGVYGFLQDRELKTLIADQVSALEPCAQRIANYALSRGSDDNLSCLLVRVKTLPTEDLGEAHRQLARYVIPPVLGNGLLIDGYRVLQLLRSSTRSYLYLVEDDNSGEQWVLKAPSENFSDDPHYLESFAREQWIGRRLNHSNVMKVSPCKRQSRFLYNLYEYIEGTDLRQWMYDNPRPDVERVRKIAEQIAAALRAFQRLGMVHRDLKPENVMIDNNNRIKLIDFGTVQVSSLQEICSPIQEACPVGSLNYIAPEYLLGQKGESRSDIFSLGVLVYEMLSGELPFKPRAYKNSVPRHYSQWNYIPIAMRRSDIPLWVDLALKGAVAPDPRDRCQALSEFTHDLRVPNKAHLQRQDQAPLIERDPLRFWKFLSLSLFILLGWSIVEILMGR